MQFSLQRFLRFALRKDQVRQPRIHADGFSQGAKDFGPFSLLPSSNNHLRSSPLAGMSRASKSSFRFPKIRQSNA
jgi:hypothetical protein